MGSKKLFSLTLILSAGLFFSSCGGKKSNKVNTNTISSGTSAISIGSNPINTAGLSSATIQAISSIEQRYSCPSGGSRIYKQFHTNQASGNMTTISANFTDGYSAGTSDGSVFIGANYSSRDLVYVQKIVSGTQVTGFNLTLSFCQVANVISSDRNLTGLRVQNMTMTTNTTLGYGTVDFASSFVYSVKDSSQTSYYPFGCGGSYYPQNPYIATYGICTNFAKPQ